MPSIALFPRSNLRNRLAADIALAGSGYRLATHSLTSNAATAVIVPPLQGDILVHDP